jgi:hypothetical protein
MLHVNIHSGYSPLVNKHSELENHHAIFMVNQLFLWTVFQFAMLNYQRVYSNLSGLQSVYLEKTPCLS